jgi:5-methylcytosine-specific restriction endonuclease McrA
MTNELTTNARFSDAELLDEIKRLTANERQATARLVAALVELDARRLYLSEGCSSLFTYCTQVLHLSEHAAYLRIEAARAARKWPAVLELLAEGALHLTAIGLLAPHLTTDNVERTLAAARHKSKREVEGMVAALRPQAPLPSSVRKLPVAHVPAPAKSLRSQPPRDSARAFTRPAVSDHANAQPVCVRRRDAEEVKPLAPERYKVQLTISRETHQMLREAQDLVRHQIPDGDIALIFERALTLLVIGLRKSRHGAVNRPRGTSPGDTGRHVPASVKRAVWERDQGQCAFIGAVGRCTERGFLEYHHRVPYADGGATSQENLELRCRAHNAYEAELWFGAGGEDLAREARASFMLW